MLIEIHLLARLFRIPLLRVDGAVAITDTDDVTGPGGHGRSVGTTLVPPAAENPVGRAPAALSTPRAPTPFGSDLAAAETVMAELRAAEGMSRRRAGT